MAAQDLWDTLSYNPPWDPMSLIQGENLSKSYGVQDVFTGVDLALPHQARVALVGMNGVGKSTLLRLLAGLESPDEGQVQRARNLRIGFLPQESIDDYPELFPQEETLWQLALGAFSELHELEGRLGQLESAMADPMQVDRALQQYGQLQEQFERDGGYTYQAHAKQVLRGLGFDDGDFKRPLAQFSGGEKTRAQLARLLLDDPELLILDEPTNHLDIEAVEWLESWLRDWPGAALIVSHDRYFLDRVAEAVWDLTPKGIDSYRGNYSAYVEQRQTQREHLASLIKAQQKHIHKEQDFIQRNIAGQKTRQAQGRRKRLERLMKDDLLTLDRDPSGAKIDFQAPTRSGDNVLETTGMSIGYADGDVLFTVPELVLRRGQRVALIGPNGVGKTTFLKTLLGETPAKSGSVKLGASLQVGYFAQAHADLNPAHSVEQEIRSAAPDMSAGELRSFLARFLFGPDDLSKSIEVLSGGERARIALMQLILEGANFLLLDEPTNHLDLLAQEALQAALELFTGTILLVSHDRYLVRALASEVWYIGEGKPSLAVYPHGYAEYLDARAAEAEQRRIERGERRRERHQPRRERMEREPTIDEVESNIQRLEAEIEALNLELVNAKDGFQQQAVLGERYRQLQQALEEQLALWERVARST